MILATRSHSADGESTNYVTTSHINLRAQCEKSSKHIATLYYTPRLLIVAPADFIKTAKQLKEHYIGYLADQDSLPMIAPFVADLLQNPTPPTPLRSERIISSLAVIDF